ncbi:MAG: S-layer homology domain-containing protein [Cellulosilyticum sp.]|nr:S-layer homology domain-containing protein [Cellulosilyticum sp.]
MLKRKLMTTLAIVIVAGGMYVGHQNGYFDNFSIKKIFSLEDSVLKEVEDVESSDSQSAESVDAENHLNTEGEVGSSNGNHEFGLAEVEEALIAQIDAANEMFKASGMSNLYSSLKKKEKKKWTDLISGNHYFEPNEIVQCEIAGLYEITNHQYYILGIGIKENSSKAEKGIFQLILLEEEGQYFVSYANYPSETILSSEEIALYKKVEQEESNVVIEYNEVDKLDELGEYVDYLGEAIGDLGIDTINDHGKSEVTQYVQYVLEDLSTELMIAEENKIEINQALVDQMKNKMTVAMNKFNELLKKNNVSFNKALNTVLRVQTEKTNFKKPIYIKLPTEIEDLGEISGLRVLFDENSYVYIEEADLKTLSDYTIKIERLKDKCTYDITFINPKGRELEQIDASVSFAFPAKDELSTVVAHFAEEPLNWGGQYDASTGVIVFGTKYSGPYKVVDDSIKINDIDNLPKSQQSAIKFMVAKGYLSVEDGNFYPEASFSRYEFAEALVKMFFALDTSLTTTFKDVPQNSPYYSYVASGETYEIIKGYMDQTFRGDVKIPKEQVISLCARTIVDKKGYIYPENTEDYLRFVDAKENCKMGNRGYCIGCSKWFNYRWW